MMVVRNGVAPPPARQLGAPPPPPATPPPPDLAGVELVVTEHFLGQPSNKTGPISTSLSIETNEGHYQCNTDAAVKEPILNSAGIDCPSLGSDRA